MSRLCKSYFMSQISRFVLALLIVCTLCGTAISQNRVTRKIETFLTRLEAVGFSGSVLVEINGKKSLSKGYGYRNEAARLKNTPDTVFDIGSVTKQFTAAAILKLEMQGKLSTDDKITKFFENVPPDKASITIHHLLRHISGLPSVVGGDFEPITESEFVDKVLKSKLRFESGSRFSYSNVGYSLLAMIIEKVAGQSYEQFLYENLWRPAGMEMTGYSRPKFDKNLIAIGYSDGKAWGRPNEKPWSGDAPYWHLKGNGGVLSTVEEMDKWHLALLSDKILTKEAKQKYYHPELRPGENDNPYYGYGWDIFRTPRNTILTRHNGTNRVFYSEVFRFIDEGTVIIMLSNKANQDFGNMVQVISRIVFEPNFTPSTPNADNEVNRAFTDELLQITIEKGAAAGFARFKARKRGVELVERRINVKGYDLLEEGKKAESIEVFRLAVLVFPKSANAFDSLGEAYLEAGNKELAIKNYTRSLELDPDNQNAVEMLKKLRQ